MRAAAALAAWTALTELLLGAVPRCEVVFMTPIVRSLEVVLVMLVVLCTLPERGTPRLAEARVLRVR